MDLIQNYVESMFKDLPRTKEVKMAQSNLSQMMIHRYNELIAQGSTPNAAMSEVILNYGDLSMVGPELGIAEVIQKQNEPLSKDEADSFLMQMKQFGRTATTSSVIILWAAIQILMFTTLNIYVRYDFERLQNGWIIFAILFIVPLLFSQIRIMIATSRIRKVCGFIYGKSVEITSDFEENYSLQKKQNQRRQTFGLILLIIAIIGSSSLQLFLSKQDALCAKDCHIWEVFGNTYFMLYNLKSYKWSAQHLASVNIVAIIFMIIGALLYIPAYIESYSYDWLLGSRGHKLIYAYGTVIFSIAYWMIVAVIFILYPGPANYFSFTFDIWPWAMALYMLILFIWHLITRKKSAK